MTGGAQASHVFRQVNGAGAVGANASFVGTLMALDASRGRARIRVHL